MYIKLNKVVLDPPQQIVSRYEKYMYMDEQERSVHLAHKSNLM